ncbi:MAG: hypothetical protein KAS32_24075 [Candidatus Peribacteraceae bacterium]|nr:hypothetical protein [Candidatus Peribacteraceae bacterium]
MAFVTNEMTKAKRQALKALFPPKKGWKFSVRKDNSTMIKIDLMEYPREFTFPERADLNYNEDHFSSSASGFNLGEAETEIMDAVKDVLNEDHWDESDSMTDYFHCAYYRSLGIGHWDKPAVAV